MFIWNAALDWLYLFIDNFYGNNRIKENHAFHKYYWNSKVIIFRY